jgi:hypothetical protein
VNEPSESCACGGKGYIVVPELSVQDAFVARTCPSCEKGRTLDLRDVSQENLAFDARDFEVAPFGGAGPFLRRAQEAGKLLASSPTSIMAVPERTPEWYEALAAMCDRCRFKELPDPGKGVAREHYGRRLWLCDLCNEEVFGS